MDAEEPAGGPTCPACQDAVDLAREPAVTCEGCLARHHARCWRDRGACAKCGGSAPLRRGEPVLASGGGARSSGGGGSGAVVAVVVAMVAVALLFFVGAGAAVYFMRRDAMRAQQQAARAEAERRAAEEVRAEVAARARGDAQARADHEAAVARQRDAERRAERDRVELEAAARADAEAGHGADDVARRTAARAGLATLREACVRFQIDCGRLPEALAELEARPPDVAGWNGPYVVSPAPLDPWGRSYVLRPPPGPLELISLAADGAWGGVGADADVWLRVEPRR